MFYRFLPWKLWRANLHAKTKTQSSLVGNYKGNCHFTFVAINRLFGKQGLPYLERYDSFHTLPSLVGTGRESFYTASRVHYVGSQAIVGIYSKQMHLKWYEPNTQWCTNKCQVPYCQNGRAHTTLRFIFPQQRNNGLCWVWYSLFPAGTVHAQQLRVATGRATPVCQKV